MQEVQALRLEQLERLTGVLVDGQAATVQTLQQYANRLEEVSNRLDVVSNRLEEVSNRVEENSKRLDTLEKLVLRVLEDLAVIRKKLDVPRMGFAPQSDGED